MMRAIKGMESRELMAVFLNMFVLVFWRIPLVAKKLGHGLIGLLASSPRLCFHVPWVEACRVVVRVLPLPCALYAR